MALGLSSEGSSLASKCARLGPTLAYRPQDQGMVSDEKKTNPVFSFYLALIGK